VKTEKKLIACSVLALLIGVSSVVPLLFLMPRTVKAETGPKPQFSVEVPYAYICRGTSLIPSDPKNPSELTEIQTVSYDIVLNYTLIEDAETAHCDARIEYYLIEIYSDKGYIGNLTENEGVSYNSSFTLPNFFFSRDSWFDANSSGGGGGFYFNWTTGESQTIMTGGHGTDWVSTFGEPETITISVRRLGWITFNGNSTVATLANGEEIARIQLEKYGDGFLYNNLLPEDQLSQINLLNPPYWKIAEANP
jgi:hypothetical protein